jgi:hypothetical protein
MPPGVVPSLRVRLLNDQPIRADGAFVLYSMTAHRLDLEPADQCEVLRWLASQLGLPAPPVVPAGATNRRANKRSRNDRLVASGYRFRHPTFRDGYAVGLRGLARHADPTTARHPRGDGRWDREGER